MNGKKFKAMLAENGETQATLADEMGISRTTLNAKISGKSDFRQNEIDYIRTRYRLSIAKIIEIFFA